MIIGITGKKRVGKDTAADFLVQYYLNQYNIMKFKLADSLKETCSLLFPECNDEKLKDTVIKKYGVKPRRILIDIGLYARKINEDVFVDRVFQKITETQSWLNRQLISIIADVRFPNELRKIKDRGGIIIKIHRDTDFESDEADDALDKYTAYDYEVYNNETIPEFENEINNIFKKIINKIGVK